MLNVGLTSAKGKEKGGLGRKNHSTKTKTKTFGQPNRELQCKNYPLHESHVEHQWLAPRTPTMLNHWLEFPRIRESVSSAQTLCDRFQQHCRRLHTLQQMYSKKRPVWHNMLLPIHATHSPRP